MFREAIRCQKVPERASLLLAVFLGQILEVTFTTVKQITGIGTETLVVITVRHRAGQRDQERVNHRGTTNNQQQIDQANCH